jgi:hypothetical protein
MGNNPQPSLISSWNLVNCPIAVAEAGMMERPLFQQSPSESAGYSEGNGGGTWAAKGYAWFNYRTTGIGLAASPRKQPGDQSRFN